MKFNPPFRFEKSDNYDWCTKTYLVYILDKDGFTVAETIYEDSAKFIVDILNAWFMRVAPDT